MKVRPVLTGRCFVQVRVVRGHSSAAKQESSEKESSRKDVSAGGDAQFVVPGVSDPFEKNGTVVEVSILKIVDFSLAIVAS